MIRMLHTADWQIGKGYGQFEPDEGALLAAARFQAVERLAALAREERVDLVLVAGDVFDAQGVADKTIHRLFHALRDYPGPWVLIPGNHDAALSESVWTRAARLDAIPAHVHVCLRPEPLLLEPPGVALLPAPLTQRHTYNDLTEWFAAAATPPGMVRIGLAHGSVQGILAEDIDSANPIAADRARQAGLDYLALGDWHGLKQVDERTWYSGTPEPDRFKDNGAGQALLVELDAPAALPRVRPLATGQYRWRTREIPLRLPSDLEMALEQLQGLDARDVAQWRFTGGADLAGHRRLQAAIEQARGRARCLQADLSALRLDPTPEDLEALRAQGYLGEVIHELRAAQAGEAGETARAALVLLAGMLDARRAPGEGGAA